jgi:hypothetical protein
LALAGTGLFFKKKIRPFGRDEQSNKVTKFFAHRARGSRERFFFVFIIITSTLRFRLRYVTVEAQRFRLRYVTAAGLKRIAARVEGPWPSLPSAYNRFTRITRFQHTRFILLYYYKSSRQEYIYIIVGSIYGKRRRLSCPISTTVSPSSLACGAAAHGNARVASPIMLCARDVMIAPIALHPSISASRSSPEMQVGPTPIAASSTQLSTSCRSKLARAANSHAASQHLALVATTCLQVSSEPVHTTVTVWPSASSTLRVSGCGT